MSFQDVGRSNSRRQPASATFGSGQRQTAGPSFGGWGGGTGGSGASNNNNNNNNSNGKPSITQISEALLQYQVCACFVENCWMHELRKYNPAIDGMISFKSRCDRVIIPVQI